MALILPDPELQALIRKEANEDVYTRNSSLQIIKEWLTKEPHLPDTWEDTGLLNFLRGCNFSIEKCKRKLDLYFTTRATAPEFFSSRDVRKPEFQEIIKNSLKDKSVTSPLAVDAMKLIFMVGDVRLVEEKFGIAGDIYILDAAVLTLSLIAKCPPSTAKKFITCIEEMYPVKLKEVHVVNVHPLAQLLFSWVKPFLKEKLVNRVHFHCDGYESLYKFIPKDRLPGEYGGSAGKLQDLHDAWVKKLEEYTPWFQEQENIKADLSKRPQHAANYDELFGMEGSFRELSVD